MSDQLQGEPDEVDYPIPGKDDPPSMHEGWHTGLCEEIRQLLLDFGYVGPGYSRLATADDLADKGTWLEVYMTVQDELGKDTPDELRTRATAILNELVEVATFTVASYPGARRLLDAVRRQDAAKDFVNERLRPRG